MAKPYSQLRAKMSAERRAQNEKRTQEIIAHLDLQELRQALDMSQQELAELLRIKQSSLSKLERRKDMRLSSLRKLVEAYGATLEVLARFPEGVIKLDLP